jgi:hypothetical protein
MRNEDRRRLCTGGGELVHCNAENPEALTPLQPAKKKRPHPKSCFTGFGYGAKGRKQICQTSTLTLLEVDVTSLLGGGGGGGGGTDAAASKAALVRGVAEV